MRFKKEVFMNPKIIIPQELLLELDRAATDLKIVTVLPALTRG